MELYKKVLNTALKKQHFFTDTSNSTINAKEIVESECYVVLKAIKDIVEDDTISNEKCIYKIERIIKVLNSIGCNCKKRNQR